MTGIGDAITLVSQAASEIGDDRRSQTLTRRHLDEALEIAALVDGEAPTSSEAWAARLEELSTHARTLSDVAAALTAERGEGPDSELVTWAEAAQLAVDSHLRDLAVLQPVSQEPSLRTIAELSDAQRSRATATVRRRRRCSSDGSRRSPIRPTGSFARWTSRFLFDPTRKLFSIGFRVHDGSLDPSYYDLLASEARLASFLAIAKGDVAAGPLVPARSLADACRPWLRADLVVGVDVRVPDAGPRDARPREQPARPDEPVGRRPPDPLRGRASAMPWGISESGFNARDLEQTYQYSSFGVPGLGLKRGLSEDIVVAPYATALAAMIDPSCSGAQLRAVDQSRRKRPVRLPGGARLHARAGSPKEHRSRSSTATWPITRGWRWWRSATSCTTGSWSTASTPTRSSRRRSCSCRSGCRATCSWLGHGPRR